MKRVLLIVIDGWTPRVFGPALDRGELPTFAALASRGWLTLDAISVFPSITPAATASIVTGEYPARHGISGMSWWNPSTGDVSYFGDDVRTVIQRGAGEFLHGFLVHLNGDRLKAPTLFQIAERQGKRAACFNHLIFRGDQEHRLTNPWPLRLLPSVGTGQTVQGPSWLCLGDFVSSAGAADLEPHGGIFDRFGLDDDGTEGFLTDLEDPGSLPDLTVAYFADYDFASHEKGPEGALPTLHRLDERLASIFERWGGLDRVLEQFCVVITADHGHSRIDGGESAGIDLNVLRRDYQAADPSTGWRDGDDVLICPNMRTAEVFYRDHGEVDVRSLADRLLEDTRVDQVIWREGLAEGSTTWHVATSDRGELRFRAVVEGGGITDEYGGRWELAGAAQALDLSVDAHALRYGAYPNALERIACGVGDAPRVLATARTGFEFAVSGQRVHRGAGSHGTLHQEDSRVPLLIAGGADGTDYSMQGTTPRIVDVVPICCEVLSLRFDWRAGQSRAGAHERTPLKELQPER